MDKNNLNFGQKENLQTSFYQCDMQAHELIKSNVKYQMIGLSTKLVRKI